MTIGRIAYLCFHRPIGQVKTCIRDGGPIEQWKTERGRREMEAAAWQLTSIGLRDQKTKRLEGVQEAGGGGQASVGRAQRPEAGGQSSEARDQISDIGHPASGRPIEVQVLTGRKFWYQTAFCLWSFAKASRREVRAVVHDDGSLDQRQAEVLLRLFPGSRVETCDMIKERLDALLPASKFPALRARRMELPLMKKILDVHAGRTGWTLFMDADLLFFRCPDFLINWWDNPSQPLTSVDVEYAYGYPLELLEELAGAKVRPLINTGLSGHRSDLIDWDKMEYWCKTLVDRAGKHYYQEQALIALLTAGRDCAVLPPEDYVTLPREPEASRCEAVMHHYVSSSKPWYFRSNWRRVAAE